MSVSGRDVAELESRGMVKITRRNFLKIGGAGLAGAALLGTTGCGVFSDGGGQQSGNNGGKKVLDDSADSDITDLNSTTTTAILPFSVLNNLNEGLYRLDTDNQPKPAQAKSADVSDDKLTYTFTLRDGIKWSNGDPIASQDFKYAWLRAMDPDTAGSYAFILTDYIEGGKDFAAGDAGRDSVAIQTPDDKTLKVKLTDPAPFFLSLTAFPTYFPLQQDFVEKQGDKFSQSPDALLYNGPYTMTDLNPSSKAVLKKNNDYWDKKNVDIEQVNLRVVKDAESGLNLYRSGDLDIVVLVGENVKRNRDDPGFQKSITFQTLFLYLNNDDPALANEDIRRALMTGFDRKTLTDNILSDGSEPAYGYVPPGMTGPDGKTFREAQGDVVPKEAPKEARKYWDKGVEALGEKPQLTFLSSDEKTSQDVATFLQEEYRKNLGADIKIKVKPFDALLDDEASGDYQIAASTWLADYNDPMTFLDLWTTNSDFNDINFSNKRYDQLIAGAKKEADENKRMQMMLEAEKILVEEDSALVPAYYVAGVTLSKPEVKYVDNFKGHPWGPQTEYKYMRLGK